MMKIKNETKINQFIRQNKSLCLILGVLMIFVVGVIATTVISDTNVNSPTGTYTNISADRINGIFYIDPTSGDLATNIQNAIGNGERNIKVIGRKGSEQKTSNTLYLNASDLKIDLGEIHYVFDGDGDMIHINASRVELDFNRIFTDNAGVVRSAIYVESGIENRINGNIIGSSTSGRNFTEAIILINNTGGNAGESIWNIGSMQGANETPHGIKIVDTINSYEGDKFFSKWIFGCTNTSIQVGTDGSGDIEYLYFEVGLDNYPNPTNTYVQTYHDKSTYILKETVIGGGIIYDIHFTSTSQDNVVLSPMSSFSFLDEGGAGKNVVYSPSTTLSDLTLLKNSTEFRMKADGEFEIYDADRDGAYFTLNRGGGELEFRLTGSEIRFASDSKPIRIAVPSGESLFFREQDTDYLKINRTGISLGSGATQYNLTLTSPDGTEFTCGVNDLGSFTCS